MCAAGFIAGLEWVEFRKFGGLSEGVVTVQIECENIEAVKKTSKYQRGEGVVIINVAIQIELGVKMAFTNCYNVIVFICSDAELLLQVKIWFTEMYQRMY